MGRYFTVLNLRAFQTKCKYRTFVQNIEINQQKYMNVLGIWEYFGFPRDVEPRGWSNKTTQKGPRGSAINYFKGRVFLAGVVSIPESLSL